MLIITNGTIRVATDEEANAVEPSPSTNGPGAIPEPETHPGPGGGPDDAPYARLTERLSTLEAVVDDLTLLTLGARPAGPEHSETALLDLLDTPMGDDEG